MESPIKNTSSIVRISVFSESNPIKESMFGLISVHVYKAVNQTGKAKLVFAAGDMPKGEVPESDNDAFAPGKKIRIEAGYGDDEQPIFEGIAVNHSFVVEGENKSTLQVECFDYAYPMTLVRKNNLFEKKKDSEAIQEIIGKYSPLSPSVEVTKTKYNELVQYYATDWDFMLSRADANGLVVVTDGKNISVKKPDVTAGAKLKITYGTDLIEFNGRLSAAGSQGSTEAFAWNHTKQEITKVSGKNPPLNEQGNLSPKKLSEAVGIDTSVLQTACAEESTLQAWADAQQQKAGLSRIQGSCKFTGSAKALHGGTIELTGLGNRFNGTAYVGYVEHEIKNGLWTTTAGLGLPFENTAEKPAVTAPAASGLLPGIQGIHIGKVTKIDEDPDGENKIQVELPILNSANNKLWARLGSCWASNGYGFFSIPDVGDEVIIAFFNNDPCFPVILGSLYSSKQKPAYPMAKENKIRAITTKSKMKIEFEEEKKVITIQTPGNNMLTISDDAKGIQLIDQNKNKIVMNDSGIVIESAKDLTLKAKMNVVIDAGSNLESKAKTNLTLKGMKIEGNAQTEMTMKGTAKAEFSASGQTIVKGAMVLIN
ncbi:MAG: type VI secretion system tip protein VgrG [Prevotellaceae bacterium]|jgi:Rhs element Vgr protein|nr:type VI secretion system tip protein VgrG [Prevotellaceae bacterium]